MTEEDENSLKRFKKNVEVRLVYRKNESDRKVHRRRVEKSTYPNRITLDPLRITNTKYLMNRKEFWTKMCLMAFIIFFSCTIINVSNVRISKHVLRFCGFSRRAGIPRKFIVSNTSSKHEEHVTYSILRNQPENVNAIDCTKVTTVLVYLLDYNRSQPRDATPLAARKGATEVADLRSIASQEILKLFRPGLN